MKKLILLLSLIAICTLAFADTYFIGTGTTTTALSPFYGLYDYSWSKVIWTAAELTTAGVPANTPITGIGFYVGNTPSNYTMLDQRIYVRTTALTSYGTAQDETGTGYPNPAGFLQLFQGDLTYNGSGWHYIMFPTPITWDGTSNLELLFENRDGSWASGYPTFRYTSTSPNYMMVYKPQDGSFPEVAGTRSYYRPNVAIITPSTTPPGEPSLISPANGATLVSITPTFTWTTPTTGGLPTGYKVYLGESSTLTDDDIIADVTVLSYTIPSSNPLQYNHTYYWTVAAYNANGTGPQAQVRNFTTIEQGYTIIGSGTSSQRQPFGIYFGYERSAALYTNAQIGGYGVLDKVAWNCATISTATVPYKIYAMQTTDTAFTAMTWDSFIASATLVDEGTHIFDTTGWHLFELDVPFPYTSGNLIVAVETYYGGSGTSPYPYFYYSTGAANCHQYWYQDNTPPTGNGTINANLPNIMLHLGALPQEPVINVSPSSWDFGLTVINTTKTKLFTLSNAGAGTLTINNITIAGNYYTLQINPANPLPINLTIGQSATFTVQFAPTAVGNFPGTVTINSNVGETIVNLSGQCYDPTIYTFPYTQDFETWPPLGWDLTGGTYSFTQYTDTYGNNWARANFWSQSAGNTDILTSPPLHPTHTPLLNFTWSHLYSTSYPNDALTVQISSDLTDWTNLWYKAGTDLNSNDGAANTAPGTGVIESISIPSSYNNTTFWIRFYAYSGYGPDLFIDNVVISTPFGPPNPVTLTYPANGATGLPQVGFNLTWTPATTGGAPDYYAVYMSQSDETIYDDYYWETTATSFNPVTQGGITFNYLDRWYWTVEAVNGDGNAVVEPPYWFIIEADPRVPLPYTQDFGTDGTWPLNWTQTYSGGVTSNRWSLSNTSNAGGTPYEMMASWTDATGVSRLISLPINTSGVSNMSIRFRTYYNDYGPGITAKVQYSHDLTNWYDSPWSIVSGSGSLTALVSTAITNLNSPTTYIAWTLDGNHYQFNYWYIDDVVLSLPPNHDVAPVSWDLPQVVGENTLVTPKATVINNGINTETFTVTCTIGNTYTNTQTVSGLAMGMTQQVTFSPLTPALWTASLVTVKTNLLTDEVAENDTLYDVLICLPLDTEGLAENVFTDQFVQFNLSTPGTMYNLPNPPTVTNFMAGADWANGKWLGCEYDDGTLVTDNFWEINPMTGASTLLGEMGFAIMGIAYDDNNNILYGTNGVNLYTMNVNTGAATLVGALWYNLEGTPTDLANMNGLLIDIAYDNYTNTLYGIDLAYDCLWEINTSTRELTLIGFLGIDINYAQDAAFDQDNGLLFLAGYAGGGALYWIDTMYGGAYKVGDFPGNAEVTAFAIPYGLISVPQVTIASNGTISWAPVNGAIKYSIYKATDPYGTFSWYADVYGTSWTDPEFTTNAKAFYKVTAVGGIRNANRQEIRYSQPIQHKGNLNRQPRYDKGLANPSIMPTKSNLNK